MRTAISLLAAVMLLGTATSAPAQRHVAGHSERLAARARRGDQLARTKLVEEHMGLVRSIALRYRDLGLPVDDLVQEGAIGLLSAIDAYDPRHGAGFSTYAFWRVRAAVTHAVTANGRHARIRAPESLDREKPDGRTLHDLVAADTDAAVESRLAAGEAARDVRSAVERLRGRKRTIVSRHFGLANDPETLGEIACDLHLSPERTRALKDEALRELAVQLRA